MIKILLNSNSELQNKLTDLQIIRHNKINIFKYTVTQEAGVADKKLLKDKQEALKANGTFNPRYKNVRDSFFQEHDFFDPRDIVQVKYEMLRKVHKEGQTVKMASETFGFSRVSFYQIQEAYDEDGLIGLSPKKHGPKQAFKLTKEVVEFIKKEMAKDRSLRPPALAQKVEERFGFSVHPRSIERALERHQKKLKRKK